MAITEQQFEEAQARAATTRQAGHAVAARYDRKHRRVVVSLHNGVELAVPVELVEGLADAAPDDLAHIEVTPAGLGLHWPKLDVRSLKGKRVKVRGESFAVIGDPRPFTDANTPGRWNRPVQVSEVNG